MMTSRWLTAAILLSVMSGCSDGGGERSYPDAPAGASELVYVATDAGREADGSPDAPFARIQPALDKVASGGAVLVAPGTYAENLHITKPVSLVGANEGQTWEQAAIIVQAPSDDAITVTDAGDVLVRGVRVVSPSRVGLNVKRSAVTVEACAIEGARTVADRFGYGLAGQESSIIVQRSAVRGSADVGGYFFASETTILQSEFRENEHGGLRIDETEQESHIEGNTIADNANFGIGIFGGRAIIVQNQITGTGIADIYDTGDGVIVTGRPDGAVANAEIVDNVIENSARVGVLVSGNTRSIIVQRNDVHGSAKDSFGAGIWLQSGAGGDARSAITDNTLTDNRFIGVGLHGDTHGIIVQKNKIQATAPGDSFIDNETVTIGDGISLLDGASAFINDNVIERSGRLGVVLDGAAPVTRVVGNIVADASLYGIIVQNLGAGVEAPDLTSNTVTGASASNVEVAAEGQRIVEVNAKEFASE